MKIPVFYIYILLNTLNILPVFAFGWSSVTTISDSSTNFDPHVRMNSSNEAIAAWTNGTYPNLSIHAAIYDGSDWSSSTNISGTEGSFAAPLVAIDGSGNIVVGWESINGDNRSIMIISKPSESGWGSPTTLSSSDSNRFFSLAMNNDGQVIAGWIDLINDKIQVATLDFGSSWSSVTDVTSGGGNKVNLFGGIDSSGNGFLLWEESSNADIAASWTTGGFESSWSAPTTLTSDDTNTSPSLAVDSAGTAIASWTEISNGDVQVSLYNSNSWSSEEIISEDYVDYSQAITSGANNFVVWLDYTTGHVQSARYVSSIWESPDDISVDTLNDLPANSVSSGTSIVAWTDLSTGELKAVEYGTTGSPSSPTVISNQDISVTPALSSSSTATIVAWEAIVGTDHVIQVNIN